MTTRTNAVSTFLRGDRTKCRTHRTIHPAASPSGAARRRSPSRRCSRRRGQPRPSRSTPATTDLAMRWDNTVRYNLGVRAQWQDSDDPRRAELRRRRPQFQQRFARHQPLRRAVGIRPRLAEEVRLPRERRRLVGRRLQQPRQHQHRDREHAGQRPAGGGRALARTRSATPRARRANGSTRSASPTSTSSTSRSTSRRASTRCTGATACSWAARSTACRTRRTRSTLEGVLAPRAREAKELFRPRGGLTIQAQPTNDLSIAGQWFYNWQAVRVPGIRKLPDGQGRRCSSAAIRTSSVRTPMPR